LPSGGGYKLVVYIQGSGLGYTTLKSLLQFINTCM
jgi:hypothetical protein